jgi:hypothetical protein
MSRAAGVGGFARSAATTLGPAISSELTRPRAKRMTSVPTASLPSIVRWNAVKALHAQEGSHYEIELQAGLRLPVGRTRYKELRDKLG